MRKTLQLFIVTVILLSAMGTIIIYDASKVTLKTAKQEYASQNFKKSYLNFLKLSSQANPEADYYLGSMYLDGLYVKQDTETAFEYFLKAARAGHAVSQYNVSLMYLDGQGVQQNKEQFLFWTQKAAEQNLPAALVNLSVLYLSGSEEEKDIAQALSCLNQAAQQGWAPAQGRLAALYLGGLFSIPQDIPQGLAYLQQAVEKGETSCQYLLGVISFFAPEITHLSRQQGLQLLNEAGMKHNPHALLMLSVIARENGRTELADKLTLMLNRDTRLTDLAKTTLRMNLLELYQDVSNQSFESQEKKLEFILEKLGISTIEPVGVLEY